MGCRASKLCSSNVSAVLAESGVLGLTIDDGMAPDQQPRLACSRTYQDRPFPCPVRVCRGLRWAQWAEGRLCLDRFPQRRARDFLPLRCAHSSRDKKISSPASFAVLQPQAVRFDRSSAK